MKFGFCNVYFPGFLGVFLLCLYYTCKCGALLKYSSVLLHLGSQWRSQLDKWGGGGSSKAGILTCRDHNTKKMKRLSVVTTD